MLRCPLAGIIAVVLTLELRTQICRRDSRQFEPRCGVRGIGGCASPVSTMVWAGVPAAESGRAKELVQEMRELKRSNEILKRSDELRERGTRLLTHELSPSPTPRAWNLRLSSSRLSNSSQG